MNSRLAALFLLFTSLPVQAQWGAGGPHEEEDKPWSYPRPPLLEGKVAVSELPGERPEVYVVVTSAGPGEPWDRVVEAIVRHRHARAVVRFEAGRFHSRGMLEALRRLAPEYVALVLPPGDLDANLAYDVLELASSLDGDPFADFLYGFVTGRTAGEALAFYDRIVKAEADRERLPERILDAGPSDVDLRRAAPGEHGKAGYEVESLYWDASAGESAFLRENLARFEGRRAIGLWGHGTPERVVDGPTPEMVRSLDLYPAVVFSGACYTGVTGRVYNDRANRSAANEVRTVPPDESLALAILERGATGYFAALTPDRGNVAAYEEHFALSTGAPLGAVAKYSYDLLVLGNRGARFHFPRYAEGEPDPDAGGAFNHCVLQLAGNGSRVLFGDPEFRPFDRVHDGYVRPEVVRTEPGAVVLALAVADPSPEAFIDVYHWGKDRVYARWEIPGSVEGVAGVDLIEAATLRAEPPIWAVESAREKRILHVEVDVPDPDQAKVRSPGARIEVRVRTGRDLQTALDWARAAGEDLLELLSSPPEDEDLAVYGGSAGAAVFLARLASATGDERYARTARAVLDRANERLSEDAGLYTGAAGIGWANLYLHRETGVAKYLEAARECGRRVASADYRATDVISGAAGAGFFLLALSQETRDPSVEEGLSRIADSLEKSAIGLSGGLRWPVDTIGLPVFYPGFSHGAAGVGTFFARLYQKTGDDLHLELAQGAARWLDAVRVEDGPRGISWWHRDPGGTDLFKVQWCHGAPGIGLFYVAMYEATGEARYLESARKAAWSTYVSGRFSRTGANQCHGLSGNAELLLELESVTGEPIWREWAEDCAELVRWKAHREGDRVWWDEGDWGTGRRSPSYMVGSSGPASFLLRLHDPERFPLPFTPRFVR